MGKYELVKPVNKDLIINPQKNFEIQQSAPLSAADIQALLSIDLDNMGGKGETKVYCSGGYIFYIVMLHKRHACRQNT